MTVGNITARSFYLARLCEIFQKWRNNSSDCYFNEILKGNFQQPLPINGTGSSGGEGLLWQQRFKCVCMWNAFASLVQFLLNLVHSYVFSYGVDQ